MISFTRIACIIVTIGLVLAWRSLFLLRALVTQTTLLPAWNWSALAAGLWTATWTLDVGTRSLSRSVADHLWYASAVAALCPAIAVLGSRRPGTRVWTAFIQIPLLFVLGWPILALCLQGDEVRGLQLETPQLAAFALVLIMGAGNHLGTRHTISAGFYAVALGLIAWSSSVRNPQFASNRTECIVWATGLMSLAVVTAGRAPGLPATIDRFDRLWLDFLNQFGVVWGRRIQDRVNHIAQQENWPGRLELDGFDWKSPPDPTIVQRVEHTFRWLLRRFADPPWIDQRLGAASEDGRVESMTTDS